MRGADPFIGEALTEFHLRRIPDDLQAASVALPADNRTTLQQVLDQLDLSEDERSYVALQIASTSGAVLSAIGARDYCQEGTDEGGRQGVVAEGMSALVSGLASGLDVRLLQVVAAVEHRPAGVSVELADGKRLAA